MITESISTHSSRHASDIALVLLEQLQLSPATAVQDCRAALSISPEELDNRISTWTGFDTGEFLYFASASHNKKSLHGVHDLFDCRDLHDSVVPVHFFPMRDGYADSAFTLTWSRIHTTLGDAFLGETSQGVCYLSFGLQLEENKAVLREMFPKAVLAEGENKWEAAIIELMSGAKTTVSHIPVHTKCTEFQGRVWSELLSTGFGKLTTYGDLAMTFADKNAARAVGSALGANPVAWIIPCHRVVNADGSCGQFRWGAARKKLFLAWEACRSAQRP